MVATSIVSFADAHGVMGKVNIAVVAWIVSQKFSCPVECGRGNYRRVLLVSAIATRERGRLYLYFGILSVLTERRLNSAAACSN